MQWAPLYMELRLLLELNKRTKELFLIIRQLSLVTDEKLKAIPKFNEIAAKKEISQKSSEENVEMDEMNDDTKISEFMHKHMKNCGKKITAKKDKARMVKMKEKFNAFHKAHSRVKILLKCWGLEEAKLMDKVEEKRRRTIVGKTVRKITRTITRISEYFAGRFRAITYGFF